MAPAVSKAQQRFFGMVLAAKRGKKPASKAVAKAAHSISGKSAGHFAATKAKGLPEHAVLRELKKRVKKAP